MDEDELRELEELRREMALSSLGDRPHSMAVGKLRRLIELQTKAARSYCCVCRGYHKLIATECRAMDSIA